jgi:hypothetical protein
MTQRRSVYDPRAVAIAFAAAVFVGTPGALFGGGGFVVTAFVAFLALLALAIALSIKARRHRS